MTILEAYTFSVNHLIETQQLPRDEACRRARLLIDFVTQIVHAHLLAPLQVLEVAQKAHWQSALEAAASGRPIPYILGQWEFWGLEFSIDERVLIPRPETELLVETVLKRIENLQSPRIADLGTGSGCIAIALAHARADASIVATDLSRASLELAQMNAHRLNVAPQIQWRAGEIDQWAAPLKASASTCGELFDVIVSNPPYIESAAIENLQIEVRAYEPRGALDGGSDGVWPYRLMASQLKPCLKPAGFLAVEFGRGQFETLRAIFSDEGWQVESALRDFAGLERVLTATLGAENG